jgi:hypothetical protein
MAAPEPVTLTYIILALSLGATGITIYLILSYQGRTHREITEIASRLALIEREFLKIKPELDEVRNGMDDRVDYATMEKKLRELISFVGEKMAKKK